MKSIYNGQLQEPGELQINDKIVLAGKLAVGVAHEVRNPLTSINGFVQLLNVGISKPEYYSMIFSELNKIEEIVNRLMKLAEPKSVNYRINNIKLILERTIMKMNELANLKDIEIILSLEGDFVTLYSDEAQLQQVFENIVKNSIEASDNNKKIYITCKTNDSHVHIEIKDQGVGIPDKRMKHLFEPFYCIKEKGTGFGLMISHKIITEHDGTIQVTSMLEIGTTVDIHLPRLNS